MSWFTILDNTNKIVEQLFAVFTFPVIISLVHWYNESFSGSFEKFQ